MFISKYYLVVVTKTYLEDKMKKIVLILVILMLSACTMTGSVTKEGPIEIGSILILTGAGASWGNSARHGIDMALEDINANGGINGRSIVVNHQDDGSDASKAVSAFRKLTDFDGIDIIIGTTWSHTGLPLVDLAKDGEVLMISPSLGVKEFNEASEFLFNTWPHDFILSAELADYVYDKGHTKVALIGAQNVWVKDQTNAFMTRFKEIGGSVEVLMEPNPDDTNLRSEALKIKENTEITAIVSTTDGVPVGARLARRAREIGVELPFFSITIDQDTINSAEGAYEGMYFLTFLTPTEEFETRYIARNGENPEIGGPSAYDAVMMLAQAMRETDSTDTKVLADYLNSIETYNGVSGTLVSDGKGGFEKPLVTKKVVNGKAITI